MKDDQQLQTKKNSHAEQVADGGGHF